MRRFLLCLALPFLLAACGGPAEPIWAPEEEVQRYAYRHDGPPKLTLFTVVSTRNGSGAHTALMVNADQRSIFDPAGTFQLPFTPERNDVHYGMTDRAVAVYIDYHARETFDVIKQEVEVTPAQAARAASLMRNYGAVPKAQCSLATSRILQQIPGFESISTSYFPTSTSDKFATLPGVTTRVISDDDADKNHRVLFEASKGPPQG